MSRLWKVRARTGSAYRQTDRRRLARQNALQRRIRASQRRCGKRKAHCRARSKSYHLRTFNLLLSTRNWSRNFGKVAPTCVGRTNEITVINYRIMRPTAITAASNRVFGPADVLRSISAQAGCRKKTAMDSVWVTSSEMWRGGAGEWVGGHCLRRYVTTLCQVT